MAEGTIGGTPISELPESSFAYCEPGDAAISTRCHFPIRGKDGKVDAAHVRNALARLATSEFEAKARPKVEAAAKELGIGEPAGKALGELKAEPFSVNQLDRWLAGKISRRILMLPYGGPIPSEKSSLGVDIDGEWFDDATDFFGGHKALIDTRARLTDWHHDTPPVGDPMKGAILGTSYFDDSAETVTIDGVDYTGRWADFWANAGERRRALVAELERRSVPLYASSQAAYRKATDGHIDVWPVIRNTISTSPQNTYAVVPALKALLAAPTIDELPAEAIKAALVGLDDATTELLLSSSEASVVSGGDKAVKAGRVLSTQNETALREALDLLGAEFLPRLQAILERAKRPERDTPP